MKNSRQPAGPLTAVVAALPEELAPMVARASVTQRSRVGRLRVQVGKLGPAPLLLASTGDGRSNAEVGARNLLENYRVTRMLVIGTAGGLSPLLREGVLVVGRLVLDGRVQVPSPDPPWVERALCCGGTVAGMVVSSDRILGTASSKTAAAAALAGDLPAVVDLESAAFAAVAARHGVPYLVVRAVCDPPQETLPLDFNSFMGQDGVDRAKVLRHALLHPSSVPPLLRLRRRVRSGSRRLARFVEELLAADRGSGSSPVICDRRAG